jgi:hypothetical protein
MSYIEWNAIGWKVQDENVHYGRVQDAGLNILYCRMERYRMEGYMMKSYIMEGYRMECYRV